MIVVLDTNVLVSAFISRHGNEARIVNSLFADQYNLAVSPSIIEEYRNVVRYSQIQKHLRWSPEEIDALIDDLLEIAIITEGTLQVQVSLDPDDNKFFSCALEAKADYIISGDRHILSISTFHDIQTISPRDFLQRVLK